MAPIVAYHATRRASRAGIHKFGLLPNQPTQARPYGVYVYRTDGELNHIMRDSLTSWYCSPDEDLWRVAYIGPLMIDQYVGNALILLGPVTHVTLVTRNYG